MGNKIKISHIMLHKGEEPIVSGDSNSKGSGAIFFSGCNLKCLYCQNYKISNGGFGKSVSIKKLAQIFKMLEDMGANNINLVTPTHYTDKIIQALKIYKPQIPIIWNTSGYELCQTIQKLDGFVDVFLTDLKYVSKQTSMLSCAPDYFEYASKSILKMREVVGDKDIIKHGLIQKGLIVRHLVLPGQSADSIKVLEFIAKKLGTNTIVSLLSQYTPQGEAVNINGLNKPISKLEYKRITSKALSLGLTNSYIQDLCSTGEELIPNFGNSDIKF